MHTSSGPRRKSTVLASLPLVLAAALASAQNDDAPVFRTSTRLVQLNVVVLDQQNHPANGLGLGDFHVFDNGVEQKLAHFSPGQDSSPASPVSPSPLLVTNRQGANDQPQAVTAILIDEFLLDSPRVVPAELTAPIRSARLAVLSYLASMPPGQRIALYAMRRDGIVVIHDFTSNSASLVAAAKTLGAGGVRGKSINLPGLRPEGARALRGWKENGRSGLRSRNLVPNDDFGSLLTAGIAAIVEHLEAVPGRKNLVWISSTLPETVSGFDMPTMLNGAGANITATPSLANPTLHQSIHHRKGSTTRCATRPLAQRLQHRRLPH
jgi:VWFA-related protein